MGVVAAAEYATAFRLRPDPAGAGRLFLAALLQVLQGPEASALTPYTSNIRVQCQEAQSFINRYVIPVRSQRQSYDEELQQPSCTLLSASRLDLTERRIYQPA